MAVHRRMLLHGARMLIQLTASPTFNRQLAPESPAAAAAHTRDSPSRERRVEEAGVSDGAGSGAGGNASTGALFYLHCSVASFGCNLPSKINLAQNLKAPSEQCSSRNGCKTLKVPKNLLSLLSNPSMTDFNTSLKNRPLDVLIFI